MSKIIIRNAWGFEPLPEDKETKVGISMTVPDLSESISSMLARAQQGIQSGAFLEGSYTDTEDFDDHEQLFTDITEVHEFIKANQETEKNQIEDLIKEKEVRGKNEARTDIAEELEIAKEEKRSGSDKAQLDLSEAEGEVRLSPDKRTKQKVTK